jgi:hypothetical protein
MGLEHPAKKPAAKKAKRTIILIRLLSKPHRKPIFTPHSSLFLI